MDALRLLVLMIVAGSLATGTIATSVVQSRVTKGIDAPSLDAPAPAAALTTTPPIRVLDVCWRGSSPVDPEFRLQRFGARLFAPETVSSETTAVVLVHGAFSNQSLWDGEGGRYGVDNGSTLPRRLAQAGYAVFTVDLIGDYGDSPYFGQFRHGSQLTHPVYVAQVHTVIERIRAADYAPGETMCLGQNITMPSFERVVLGGHGFGALLARHYVTEHTNVDALISFAWIDKGPSTDAWSQMAQCQHGSPPALDGYVDLICQDRGGWVLNCSPLLMWVSGADNDVVMGYCSPRMVLSDPAPLLTFPSLMAPTSDRIERVPAIPVLFVYAELDHFLYPKAGSQAPLDDAQVWIENCQCQVDAFLQEDAGHILMLHRSFNATTERVLQWLEENRFEAPPNESVEPERSAKGDSREIRPFREP